MTRSNQAPVKQVSPDAAHLDPADQTNQTAPSTNRSTLSPSERNKLIRQRTLALIFLAFFGLLSAIGLDWLKDSFFSALSGIGFRWWKVLFGFIFFITGLAFLAGFNFYRDVKRSYTQPKFIKWYRRRQKAKKNKEKKTSTHTPGVKRS